MQPTPNRPLHLVPISQVHGEILDFDINDLYNTDHNLYTLVNFNILFSVLVIIIKYFLLM